MNNIKYVVLDYIIDVIGDDIKVVIENNIKDVVPDYRCYQI